MRWTLEDETREWQLIMPPVITTDLTGKTVNLTGANVGIGFEAAKHFARMNPERLIIVCRSQEKGDEAKKVIQEETKFPHIEAWTMDLSDFTSVKAFADRAEKELERIDYLVENAGVAHPGRYKITKDGWEETLQVNDLATILLAFLLLPKMLHTAKKYGTYPRLVVVASNTYFWSTLEREIIDAPKGKILETFSSEKYCLKDPQILEDRYQDTKLFDVLFVRALSSRLPPHSQGPMVTPVAINPSFCLSSLHRGFYDPSVSSNERITKRREIIEEGKKQAFTSEEGSRQLIYAAIAHKDEGQVGEEKMRGGYVSFSDLIEASDFVLSEDGRKFEDKLWNEYIDILSKVDGRVEKIVAEHLIPKNN
ncbi:NAD(P)-binding protein [Dendrothele bispora CBS 962.96]|uniref:NAD(P)-binding protein n=1 Tax=Dendrothele bispora (strain CBS 962.96) TaxID=1314807 RepID=A0A4S8MD19_DENBC|nr:NAD(P)-binding protein [Dendrothele bispora CBS 962.96]